MSEDRRPKIRVRQLSRSIRELRKRKEFLATLLADPARRDPLPPRKVLWMIGEHTALQVVIQTLDQHHDYIFGAALAQDLANPITEEKSNATTL